jgi:hypothetical protein
LCYMPHPPHLSSFYQPSNIWWRVQITELLICGWLQSCPLLTGP